MRNSMPCCGLILLLASSIAAAAAPTAETQLFNGQNLDGWTFHPEDDEQPSATEVWTAARGALISRGLGSGYLIHKDSFEDYVLTLEVRTMSTAEGNGTAVGSLGSVFVNAIPERGSFNNPKSIEISLRDEGDVYFRDLSDEERHNTDTWVHRAPERRDDVERDMGEWNRLKVICHGKRLTVLMNGTPVNQIEPINRTRGALAIKCTRGFIAAPTFYRNITVKPISSADLADEKRALGEFARAKALVAQQRAAQEAAMRAEQEKQEVAEKKLAQEWANVQVTENANFAADVRQLPYPKDARDIEFSSAFGDVEFQSRSSLAKLSQFYRTEMAKRGWQITETEIESDEVTITYQQGEAEVELNLDGDSDGVDVSLDCEELSFEGTDDPVELAKLGIPQPQAYLVLQRELKLPENYRDQEYDSGDRRLFKSTLKLPELYEFLTQQLRSKGYRESRRPILNNGRRYSEFVKNGVEISVNTFTHEIGSRAILTYEVD